jgi:hypothetical protein
MSTMPLASTTPYWGRAYTLTVYSTPDGSGSPGVTISSSAWEPEALRITFDVHQCYGECSDERSVGDA